MKVGARFRGFRQRKSTDLKIFGSTIKVNIDHYKLLIVWITVVGNENWKVQYKKVFPRYRLILPAQMHVFDKYAINLQQ